MFSVPYLAFRVDGSVFRVDGIAVGAPTRPLLQVDRRVHTRHLGKFLRLSLWGLLFLVRVWASSFLWDFRLSHLHRDECVVFSV